MENILNGITNELQKDMEQIQPATNNKMQQAMQSCFIKSGGNHDRFAECVVSANKKISDIVEPLQLKLLFVTKSAEQCLQKNKSEQECTQEGVKIGKDIIEGMKKGIQRI